MDTFGSHYPVPAVERYHMSGHTFSGLFYRNGFQGEVTGGLNASIPCNFTADGRNTFRNSFGYWRHLSPDSIVATNDKSSAVQKTNFHLMGNPDCGDCTLTITDARREDKGRYYFRFMESTNSEVKYSYKEITTHIIVTGITGQLAGYTISVASSVCVQEGLCVTIPCKFTANFKSTVTNSYGYWKRSTSEKKCPNSDPNVATNDDSSAAQTNFNLTGNPDSGDCTLTLTNATGTDAGTYYFRFDEIRSSRNKYSYCMDKTKMTVTGLTEEPVISDVGTVTAGISNTLTCAPPDNCPATSLRFQWKKSNVPGIWKTSSTVTFTPSADDDQKKITCEMTNAQGRTTQKTILLHVYSPLNITITWEIPGKKKNKPDPIKLDEGSSMTLTCSVQSTLTLNVTWTDEKNNVLQNGTEKELELRLENIIMTQAGVYTCTAMNDYVNKSANINVIVQYPPRNMKITITSSEGGQRPASQPVVIGPAETLTLVCSVNANPNATLIWVKGEVDTESPTTNNSRLSVMINVTLSTADVYRCLAWNALGLAERRIQVGAKTDGSGTTTETAISDAVSYRDIAIGFICGMSVVLLIVLLYKLIRRKTMTKKKTYVRTDEPSTSAEPPIDEIYMNVGKPEQKAEETTDNNIQLDSSGVASDQEDLHYSTLVFTAKPTKVASSQPETEYAEIQVK